VWVRVLYTVEGGWAHTGRVSEHWMRFGGKIIRGRWEFGEFGFVVKPLTHGHVAKDVGRTPGTANAAPERQRALQGW
jgi:hypothetical protein